MRLHSGFFNGRILTLTLTLSLTLTLVLTLFLARTLTVTLNLTLTLSSNLVTAMAGSKCNHYVTAHAHCIVRFSLPLYPHSPPHPLFFPPLPPCQTLPSLPGSTATTTTPLWLRTTQWWT